MKNILISFMILLGGIVNAQSFDFDCDPFPAEIIKFEVRDGIFKPRPEAFIEINGRIPLDGLRGRTAFLGGFKGLVISAGYSLSNETGFLIANISLSDLQKLETKFKNNESIYLDIN